jgi:DnaJ like chaperone protein
MSWLGGAVGYILGARFGALGGIVGAVLGSGIGDFIKDAVQDTAQRKRMAEEARGRIRSRATRRGSARRTTAARTAMEREILFLSAVGSMFAKLSKVDGRVDESEIAAGEKAFARLGLTPEKRRICINAFRAAKTDSNSIFEYAEAFADVTSSLAVRELLYDMLWDIACADGVLASEERGILETIVTQLRIRPSLYSEQYFRRMSSRRGTRSHGSATPGPYEVLGCSPNATDDELRRAYRSLAKRHHPDVLRSQGLPEEMIGRATEKMAGINAAWDEIRRARGI